MAGVVEKKVVWIRQVVVYGSERFASESNLAKQSGTLATSAIEIIRRVEEGYNGEFVIIEPDIPAATGLYDGIVEAVKDAGYEVEMMKPDSSLFLLLLQRLRR